MFFALVFVFKFFPTQTSYILQFSANKYIYTGNSTIFIAVIANDQRRFDPIIFLNNCGYSFLNSSYYGGLAFITNRNYVDRGYTHIIFRDSNLSTGQLDGNFDTNYHISLMHRRVLATKYFLKNTKATYFALINDHTQVFVENIPKLLYSLERQQNINSETDPLFIGNCLNYYDTPSFLQGGAGNLLSRKAARDFLAIQSQWRMTVDIRFADDVLVTNALLLMHYSLETIDSPFFLGQYCSPEMKKIFESNTTISKSQLYKIPICPKSFKLKAQPGRCVQHWGRFRDLVFLHRLTQVGPWPETFKPLSHYPSSLYFTNYYSELPSFCIKKHHARIYR